MPKFSWKFHLRWLIPLLMLDAALFIFWWKKYARAPAPPEKETVARLAPPRLKLCFGFPTDRELARWNPEAFQPTASGRPESAFYGSVRTGLIGKKLLPAFHEGVDIAPLERDPAGPPRDAVGAAAAGEVVYVNRPAGDSNYGKYVVIAHGGGPGKLYTLYAHLDKINPRLRTGMKIEAGEILGIMGATSTDRILPANAHLHFEVNLMLNSNFNGWMKRRRTRNEHGPFNGWNLIGIDPLAVYERQEAEGGQYDLSAHLESLPPAFEITLKAVRQLDFFKRYPALWRGGAFPGGAMALACSANGLPLRGRPARENEISELGRRKYLVRGVDLAALGRNGCRIVVQENGKWRLGVEGEKWLSLLAYY